MLHGTTEGGGVGNVGTVFSLTPPASPSDAWTETVLYTFIYDVARRSSQTPGPQTLETVFELTP
jgi:hypothetical protein